MTTNEPPIGTLLCVSGPSTGAARRPIEELVRELEARLDQSVVLCVPDATGEDSVAAGIRSLVACGVQRLVVLPLNLSPEQGDVTIPEAVKWASRRWPFLAFHAAPALSLERWAAHLTELAQFAVGHNEEGLVGQVSNLSGQVGNLSHKRALLIAGPGGYTPRANANLALLAQMVRDSSSFARVDHVFLDGARPGVAEGMRVLARLDLHEVIVVPWLLHRSGDAAQLATQISQAAQEFNLRATLAPAALTQPALLDLLAEHHAAGLADTTFLAPTWSEVRAEIGRNLGPATHAPGQAISAEEEAQLAELDRKINELLPPEYQGRYEQVCPQSMGTAALKYGTDGKVAWNEIWTSFCDLALAGGPPHRGTLLEAATADEANAEPEKYKEVVTEIERGIRLVTGLPIVPSSTPGWVGVRCDSEAMAIWLMRAIIVENVMVRRQGDVLYLPAGPHFTLKREIKNVVTVIAKTAHYWSAHLTARQRSC